MLQPERCALFGRTSFDWRPRDLGAFALLVVRGRIGRVVHDEHRKFGSDIQIVGEALARVRRGMCGHS
jgi:hypothetical protein